MKKFILVSATSCVITAVVGYLLGAFLFPPDASAEREHEDPAVHQSTTLYKLPLGRFTFQAYAPHEARHYVAEMDVLIAGAANFEQINGADGKNRLRDAVIAIAADLTDSPQWEELASSDNWEGIEKEITNRIRARFPMVHTTKILSFISSVQK